jgi:hypothetical protein
MKLKVLLLLILPVLLGSCSSTFYQLYEVKPEQAIKKQDNRLVYEDENCIITYNLWADEGNSGFSIHNKTRQDLTLHLDESFFILNGTAYDYYKNRITSSSRMVSTATSSTNSLALLFGGYATNTTQVATTGDRGVAYVEKPKITIPPNSSKRVAEYAISQSLFRSCDLYRFPNRNQVKTQNFNEANSPVVFKNSIKYSLDNNDERIAIENSFYVNAITNYPESEFTEKKQDEFCGKKNPNISTSFVKYSPDRFYIKYEKGKTGTTVH